MRRKSLYWRINNKIHAPKVRVIGEGGKQVGVVTIEKALELAKKAKTDLVEIAPRAKPPVVKIVDFGKFKYEQEKKLRQEKKKSKPLDLKEVRLSPFIGDHDFNTRLDRIKEFLQEKHKVRVVVKFKGRQMGSKKFGYELLKKVLGEVEGKITVDMEPKFIGRHLTMVISPTTKGVKNKQKEEK